MKKLSLFVLLWLVAAQSSYGAATINERCMQIAREAGYNIPKNAPIIGYADGTCLITLGWDLIPADGPCSEGRLYRRLFVRTLERSLRRQEDLAVSCVSSSTSPTNENSVCLVWSCGGLEGGDTCSCTQWGDTVSGNSGGY